MLDIATNIHKVNPNNRIDIVIYDRKENSAFLVDISLLAAGDSSIVMVRKIGKWTIFRGFDSHWTVHVSGFVPINSERCKLLLLNRTNMKFKFENAGRKIICANLLSEEISDIKLSEWNSGQELRNL